MEGTAHLMKGRGGLPELNDLLFIGLALAALAMIAISIYMCLKRRESELEDLDAKKM